MCMHHVSDVRLPSTGRRPFLLFLLGAGLFVTAVTIVLFYSISRPQTATIEAQERQAVDQCWSSSRSLTMSSASRRFQTDACREMEVQLQRKYGHRR